jgi:glycosyltransferase involved in cell wall biosynthesis
VQPTIFELLDGTILRSSGETALSKRQIRLLAGAANYYSLAYPGRIIRLTVLRGPKGSLPRLTDRDRNTTVWPTDRTAIGFALVRSLVGQPKADDAAPLNFTIDLGGDSDSATTPYHQLRGPLGALRRTIRFRAPIQFDALRQFRTDLAERRRWRQDIPRQGTVSLDAPQRERELERPPAVIFGLHWLELGGAERWALECIKLARESQLVPIVLTDRPSAHPWIVRSELDGALIVPLTLPLEPAAESAFLSGLLESFDIRGVHLHHCTWLYERLPWLKTQRPETSVVDSLHIAEWRTGGFVDLSVRMTDVIDYHHVISPWMRDHLIGRRRIDSAKVALATLADLTAGDIARGGDILGHPTVGTFTVAFVGRYTQQKRPYLFLALARQLLRISPVPMRFVMHGEGELGEEVRALRDRLGLTAVLELRSSDKPVSDTLREADALVVSSDNEGLTLTTFEATSAGVPVISTDVGSQASLVADDLLCPRHPYAFLAVVTQRVLEMVESDGRRKTWLDEQAAKAMRFAELPRAREWTRKLYEGWR